MKQLIRKVLFLNLIFFFSLTLLAQTDCESQQRQDVGIIGGGTFYMGDLTDNYSLFRNFSYYVGALYRYNITDYYAVRGQMSYGEVRGDMLRSDMPSFRPNGDTWAFHRPMLLIDAIGEIGFMPLNVFDLRKNNRLAPFLMGGFGVTSLMNDGSLNIQDDKEGFYGYLLVGFGVKYVLQKRVTVSAEWIMRKTFSDKVDYHSGIAGSQLINQDWIGTLGITISYRLPQDNPCTRYSKALTDPADKNRKKSVTRKK